MRYKNTSKINLKCLLIGGSFFILLFFFSSCNVYYDLFYTDPDKCFAEAKLNKPYDVIIVPGYPHDSGKVDPIVANRIKWAYYLYVNGFAKNIIFSGAAVHSPYVESEAMRLFALQAGIKNENIFVETRAEHTTENLYYGCRLAEQLGFKKIAFASEPAQSSFMKPFKRKFKLDVNFLPMVSDTLNRYKFNLAPMDESGAFKKDFVPLVKREGLWKRLSGTRGHKVKKDIRKERREKRKKARGGF